jgi:predicted membrane channel-forming protein YqfA (hemolysin III family)
MDHIIKRSYGWRSDTSAYSQDLIDAHLAEIHALQKKVQPAESLVEDVTVGLFSLASFIYKNDLKENGVSQSRVFPWDQVQKVPQECLAIENEKTIQVDYFQCSKSMWRWMIVSGSNVVFRNMCVL